MPKGPLRLWSLLTILGGVLIGGVVAWKLLASTYRADVRTICHAEGESGLTIQRNMPKVMQWVRAHLATPEGNMLFSALSDEKLLDRVRHLRSVSSKLNLGACPMTGAYERLAAEGGYRADLQHICSSLTFPKLAELDDDARLARLEEFLDTQARSPRTKELAEPLRFAPAAERGKLLREVAGRMDVYSCETAKVLELPVATPASGEGLAVP